MLGVLWYYCGDILTRIMDLMIARTPSLSFFSAENTSFAEAIFYYTLFFALIGLTYKLYVDVIREKNPEGYYG